MLRMMFVLAGLSVLGACALRPPAPYIAKLQELCAAGDASACGYLAQADAQNRQAAMTAYQGLMASNPYLRPQPVTTPMMQTTNCRPTYNGGMNCTSY